MKYTARILFIAIAVLYALVMAVGLGLLLLPGARNGLVSSETTWLMLGLWLTLPVALGLLSVAVVKTAKAKSTPRVKAMAYLSGAFAMGAALLLAVLLTMTALGLLHPRQSALTLTTGDCFRTYDGTALEGSPPEITQGSLHEGHRLQVLSIPAHTRAGEYPNAPQFRILDEAGKDVTEQYEICENFGTIRVEPRKITLSAPEMSKIYDGEPLQSEAVRLTGGTLLPGHRLSAQPGNALTLPGTEPIRPVYQILTESGDDVTDQYQVTEDVGTLTVQPVEITVTTDSKTKPYDGQSLSAPGWQQTAGQLLEGHSLQMQVNTVLEDAGTALNQGIAQVLDSQGRDVTDLYGIHYQYGTLTIQPMPLQITTDSAKKVYDGTPLICVEWKLTGGKLQQGCQLIMVAAPTLTQVGTVENAMEFMVLDANDLDVTHRYAITGSYGTLTVQPRSITIRTDSAQKPYDGTPLSCDTFRIASGSLCDGDWVELVGVSITNVGYTENYPVSCTVYRKDDQGNTIDVSACYRISFDYGVLQVTPE